MYCSKYSLRLAKLTEVKAIRYVCVAFQVLKINASLFIRSILPDDAGTVTPPPSPHHIANPYLSFLLRFITSINTFMSPATVWTIFIFILVLFVDISFNSHTVSY